MSVVTNSGYRSSSMVECIVIWGQSLFLPKDIKKEWILSVFTNSGYRSSSMVQCIVISRPFVCSYPAHVAWYSRLTCSMSTTFRRCCSSTNDIGNTSVGCATCSVRPRTPKDIKEEWVSFYQSFVPVLQYGPMYCDLRPIFVLTQWKRRVQCYYIANHLILNHEEHRGG